MSKNSYLITGGTGSFGNAFVSNLIKFKKNISKLVIFSRDELKQSIMSSKYPHSKYPFIRFYIGDVRDSERILSASEGIENIIHAAALKQVPSTEYNPFEAVQTNIIGSQNVIKAALSNNVKKVVALSTDKACAPINLYGATKLCSDKLFISANNIKGKRDIKFSVVRYGNVFGSRGSVYPLFKSLIDEKTFPITDKNMTRFNISLDEGVSYVMWAIENSYGGEIIVPKIPSIKVVDLANAISPNSKKEIIGIRQGEKIHEELISTSESEVSYDIKKYYVILNHNKELINYYIKNYNAKKVSKNFYYNSENNNDYLTVKEIKNIIETKDLGL